MSVRIYLRRSKNDEGKQQFSLDVQRKGCLEFLRQRGLATQGQVVEYIDDGKAGDDFYTRHAIRKLVADTKPGDVLVCRDQSRLGRDALEVTLVIRELVRDHGGNLFYYTTGQRVQFDNAIDQATAFIMGTGHQIELEAIRSRTREALRSRVREGRIAGGRCFGYRLQRQSDSSGRPYTIAVIDPQQAAIVDRIFREYLWGRGLKAIAARLNEESVPSPTVGRRGTGTWAPSAIRAMLMNQRYRGLYIHGRIKKTRRDGRIQRTLADPSDVIMVDLPEWRIIDDETWFAVQEIFRMRKTDTGSRGRGRPVAKYPLSGIARCGQCGGSIGSARTTRSGKVVPAYTCLTHHTRGRSVCDVSIYQDSSQIEAELLAYLQVHVLTPAVVESVLTEIRDEIQRQFGTTAIDIEPLQAELKRLRTEQQRLAKAIALADDSPELVSELNSRQSRIRNLELKIATAKRTPDAAAEIMQKVEDVARLKLQRLREALLDDREGLRELFTTLFPDGLVFKPTRRSGRQVWAISGCADLGNFNGNGDPNGI